MNRIDFNNIQEKDYLYNFCSLFYDEYFTSKENLKSFEREIWMIGSELIDNIRKTRTKKKILTDILLEELLKIVREYKFGRGRESFVMLLHYFKNNPKVESSLAELLNDEQLYAFAIDELTKLKIFKYVDKIQNFLLEEKISWRRKVEKRYIEKSSNI
ncbi:hypothetical protein [Capnocytophaga gingivalis]